MAPRVAVGFSRLHWGKVVAATFCVRRWGSFRIDCCSMARAFISPYILLFLSSYLRNSRGFVEKRGNNRGGSLRAGIGKSDVKHYPQEVWIFIFSVINIFAIPYMRGRSKVHFCVSSRGDAHSAARGGGGNRRTLSATRLQHSAYFRKNWRNASAPPTSPDAFVDFSGNALPSFHNVRAISAQPPFDFRATLPLLSNNFHATLARLSRNFRLTSVQLRRNFTRSPDSSVAIASGFP